MADTNPTPIQPPTPPAVSPAPVVPVPDVAQSTSSVSPTPVTSTTPVMQTVPVTPPQPVSPPPVSTAPAAPKEDLSKYTIGGNDSDSGSGGTPSKRGSEEVTLEKKNAKLYIIGIILAVVVLLSTIVVLYIRAQQAIEEKGAVETETVEEVVVEPSPSPESTPIPREDISLDILNGSGTAGLASSVADTFEELGYEILEVGNADEIEGNQLYVNPDIDEDLLTLLLEDVLEELDIASISGELEDSSASAQIILGS